MKNNINRQIEQVTRYAALFLIGVVSRGAELVNQTTKPGRYAKVHKAR